MVFVKGDPNINRKGRPLKGDTLTDMMREFLMECPKDQKKTYKRLFIEKAYHKAVKEGDPTAIKLIWNYLDGMPIQKIGGEGEDGELIIKWQKE